MRVHKQLAEAHKKGEKVPDLVARLSKEYDNQHLTPEWSKNWEDMRIPVEWVVAYWSRVLAPVSIAVGKADSKERVERMRDWESREVTTAYEGNLRVTSLALTSGFCQWTGS